jgi:quinolinate synthase
MRVEEYVGLTTAELSARIDEMKRRKNAIILGHNYQTGAVQGVSDFLGDSLRLSQLAHETDADIVVFCGVRFMAESAKILSPGKKILLPSSDAGCPMADMITGAELDEFKAAHPGVPVVCYVNTSAEVKAKSDVCCTSSNAVGIVEAIEGDEVLFVPDRNLAAYVSTKVRKNVIPWSGHCYVHNMFVAEDIELARRERPGVKVVVHPECPPEVTAEADYVCSTGGMMRLAPEHDELIVGTEIGLVDRMNREHPGKAFHPLSALAICRTMKMTSLPLVAWALENEQHEITVPEGVRARAERALARMLDLS